MRDDATNTYRDVLRFFDNNNDFITSLIASGDGLLLASKQG
jgi:hypothetical protein